MNAGQIAAFSQGFALSAGLIVAIGAQNVFVLTQGARSHRPWLVATVCTACDALLITTGVGGVGGLIAGSPALAGALGLAGAAFLAVYGLRALRGAMAGECMTADVQGDAPDARAIVLTTLGVSLLNPHALLDTIVLIGGLSGRLPHDARPAFGVGAACASASWFFSLSLGGRLLAPLLRRPAAWRALAALVCLVMWGLAVGVGRDALTSLAALVG